MEKNPPGVLNALRQQTHSNRRLGWLKTAAWIIPVWLSSLDRKSSLPDIKFHKIFEKYLQRKRLHQIIKYLNNIHQESDAEFEINISGKKFIVGPGVFCPKDTYASEFLAQHLVVRPGDKVLDLGTGTGIQAIVAADRAGKVIATDINPKAVYYAEKNARLNGVKEKIEVKSGDLFDPVRNERFDLIIWNAPYLPLNPHSVLEMSWCSGQNQKLIETFLRDAKTHLTERGRIEILFSSIGDLSWFINQAGSSSYTVNILSSLSAGWEHLVILVLVPR